MPLLKFLPEWLNNVCGGTAERISKVQLMIYRKTLVPFKQVLNAVISCPPIRHNNSTREVILPDKRHKGSSTPVFHCNNKALIAPPLDPYKTPLMWNKSFFFCGPNRLINLDNFAGPPNLTGCTFKQDTSRKAFTFQPQEFANTIGNSEGLPAKSQNICWE